MDAFCHNGNGFLASTPKDAYERTLDLPSTMAPMNNEGLVLVRLWWNVIRGSRRHPGR